MHHLANGPAQLYFLLRNLNPWLVDVQAPHQRKPLLLRHDEFLVLTVSTGQQPHFINLRQSDELLYQGQVGQVGWVEGTSVNSDLFQHLQ